MDNNEKRAELNAEYYKLVAQLATDSLDGKPYNDEKVNQIKKIQSDIMQLDVDDAMDRQKLINNSLGRMEEI